MKIDLALLSVSEKQGLVPLAEELHRMGIQILSTGGTGRVLHEAGIPYTAVAEHTGFPEILEGRVKTLHPRIHGALLARLEKEEDRQTLEQHSIPPIGLVVVNLYPFSDTVERKGVAEEEALEQIDIGGPTLIRASAKNFRNVTVMVDPSDYSRVLQELKEKDRQTTHETRSELARKAFHHTAAYDAAIATWFDRRLHTGQTDLPASLPLHLHRQSVLRYGENPHQRGALYRCGWGPAAGLPAARQLQGKQLSFNNYMDLAAAWELSTEFDRTACVIVKHTNPCGTAVADSLVEAYRRALACDPVSAFGSVIGFNRTVTAETARELKSLFVEAIIAPAFHPQALEVLSSKENLRLMEMKQEEGGDNLDVKRIPGGFLVQDCDKFHLLQQDLKTVTRRSPNEVELEDLMFSWTVARHVKSNAIVFARGGRTVGIGAGQMSRVDSVKLAELKAHGPLDHAVMASDAFFPFRDAVDEAARCGIRAIIQPGGSIRDSEVIQAADEHGMAMVFTGIRHFKH